MGGVKSVFFLPYSDSFKILLIDWFKFYEIQQGKNSDFTEILSTSFEDQHWIIGIWWGKFYSKVGCVFSMIVVSLLLHAEFRRNDHREDAPHFTLSLISNFLDFKKTYFCICGTLPDSWKSSLTNNSFKLKIIEVWSQNLLIITSWFCCYRSVLKNCCWNARITWSSGITLHTIRLCIFNNCDFQSS